jgi:hypothetical protein
VESVILLNHGKVTRVSQIDYAFLSQWGWHAESTRGCHYALRRDTIAEGHKFHRMHRIIAARMGLDLSHFIDHIDGDGLNNTRLNLRASTNAQNLQNRGKQRNNTSGIKGVCRDKTNSKWLAQIWCGGTKHYLGRFDTKEEAAEAYRKAAKKLHKEFAKI